MSGRREILSPEGLRLDGRRPGELRTLNSKLGCIPQADGSASLSMGNTRVIVTINGPREPRVRGSVVHDRATINVAFHAASFSSVGGDRRKLGASGVPGSEGIDGIGLSRTTVGGRPDRKMIQWGHYVEDIFSTAVPLTLFPRSQIDISIEVLNADGGILAAAINATCLAFVDAGIPIFDYVFAVSVAHTGKAVLSDTNRLEEISMGGASIPRMTIAAFARQPAEANLLVDLEAPPCLGPDRLSSMLESGSTAITKLFEIFDGTVVRPEVDALYQAKKF